MPGPDSLGSRIVPRSVRPRSPSNHPIEASTRTRCSANEAMAPDDAVCLLADASTLDQRQAEVRAPMRCLGWSPNPTFLC